jgi:glutamate-1-semialdehyde 2,1-aminomutase
MSLPPSALGLRSDPIKIPDSSGLNRTALDDTIVVPWNDLPALQRAVENHPGQIAAIITEGIMANMGVIPPADPDICRPAGTRSRPRHSFYSR